MRSLRTYGAGSLVRVSCAALTLALVLASLGGCGTQPQAPSSGGRSALPDSAYYMDESLETWIDPETGYDTTRQWTLDGDTWPICLVMSPSQSPQLLVGEREGIYAEALKPFGITPVVEKLELPPRTFHALQRSKWPFVYMPYAVFVDYSRTQENQGGAGGLQYVALAGSTEGGGYTLITKDPSITSVADLAGKTVAGMENNPARIMLMQAAAEQVGLTVGDDDSSIHLASGESAQDLNDYLDGKYDAVMVLSIVRERFLRTGSRALTEFTDTKYQPDYTILCVERSVLEKQPDVVDAFLEAHYQAQQRVMSEDQEQLVQLLMDSWNGYFESQDTTVAAQRIAPDTDSFMRLYGTMRPDDQADSSLLSDCFSYLEEHNLWGWDGSVDWQRLLALDRYEAVLREHGEEPR